MAAVTGFTARERRNGHAWTTSGCLVLAVALSALAVATLARIAWADLAAHLEARNWPTAQAQVLAVSLHRHASQERGGARQQLVLSSVYTYEIHGVRYEGGRVGLRDVGDPQDRDLQALYGRLNFARLTGRPISVAYDPAEPSRALIDASLDWWPVARGLGLGLAIFVAAGLSIGAAVRSQRREV